MATNLPAAYAYLALEAAGYEQGEKSVNRFVRVDNPVTFSALVIADTGEVSLHGQVTPYQGTPLNMRVSLKAPMLASEVQQGERNLCAALFDALKAYDDTIEADYQARKLNYAALYSWLDERRQAENIFNPV